MMILTGDGAGLGYESAAPGELSPTVVFSALANLCAFGFALCIALLSGAFKT